MACAYKGKRNKKITFIRLKSTTYVLEVLSTSNSKNAISILLTFSPENRYSQMISIGYNPG